MGEQREDGIVSGQNLRKSRLASKSLAIHVSDERNKEDQKAVDDFRNLLLSENLLSARHDDYHLLLRFLRAQKYDSQKAKERGLSLFSMRDERWRTELLSVAVGARITRGISGRQELYDEGLLGCGLAEVLLEIVSVSCDATASLMGCRRR